MTDDEAKVSEIAERVRKSICPTYSSDGKESIEGRITKDDFDYLMASWTSWKIVAKHNASLAERRSMRRWGIGGRGMIWEREMMRHLTMLGMILVALGLAGISGHIEGALPMLGMWLIWEDVQRKKSRRNPEGSRRPVEPGRK